MNCIRQTKSESKIYIIYHYILDAGVVDVKHAKIEALKRKAPYQNHAFLFKH